MSNTTDIASGIGVFFLWVMGATVAVIGFFSWIVMLLASFAVGNWGMALVQLLFCEVIIPLMGVVNLFRIIFHV